MQNSNTSFWMLRRLVLWYVLPLLVPPGLKVTLYGFISLQLRSHGCVVHISLGFFYHTNTAQLGDNAPKFYCSCERTKIAQVLSGVFVLNQEAEGPRPSCSTVPAVRCGWHCSSHWANTCPPTPAQSPPLCPCWLTGSLGVSQHQEYQNSV